MASQEAGVRLRSCMEELVVLLAVARALGDL